MALTAAWMALAGLACAVVAWRRADLRLPVLAAFLITATAAGAYLGRSQFFDDVVNERVATVSGSPTPDGAPRNVLVAQGSFEPVAHSARGRAQVIRTPRGRVLTL